MEVFGVEKTERGNERALGPYSLILSYHRPPTGGQVNQAVYGQFPRMVAVNLLKKTG